MISPLFYDDLEYRLVKDGDPAALELVNRHYSRQWLGNLNSRQFVGAGVPMVILGVHADWLFVWRFARYRADLETGVECAIFRNESPELSSRLILLCESVWDQHHGPTRKFTYVHPEKIRSTNPGCCFQKAGWTRRDNPSSRGLVCWFKEVA